MPIILGDFDDESMSCCGQVDIQPLPAQTSERREEQRERMDREMERQENRQMERPMERPMERRMDPQGQMPQNQMQQMQPMVVGMAYVPWQRWQQPYALEEGFPVGTIFPDLNLPFTGYGERGMRR